MQEPLQPNQSANQLSVPRSINPGTGFDWLCGNSKHGQSVEAYFMTRQGTWGRKMFRFLAMLSYLHFGYAFHDFTSDGHNSTNQSPLIPTLPHLPNLVTSCQKLVEAPTKQVAWTMRLGAGGGEIRRNQAGVFVIINPPSSVHLNLSYLEREHRKQLTLLSDRLRLTGAARTMPIPALVLRVAQWLCPTHRFHRMPVPVVQEKI